MRAKGDCQLSLHTHPPVLVQLKHLRSERDSWVQRRTPGNTQPHLNSLAVALVQVWQDLMSISLSGCSHHHFMRRSCLRRRGGHRPALQRLFHAAPCLVFGHDLLQVPTRSPSETLIQFSRENS